MLRLCCVGGGADVPISDYVKIYMKTIKKKKQENKEEAYKQQVTASCKEFNACAL